MIGLDDNGNFEVGTNGNLKLSQFPSIQNAKSELRCTQGTWFMDEFFGRSPLVWELSQSVRDRSLDIRRIAEKYASVLSVDYDTVSQTYTIRFSNA